MNKTAYALLIVAIVCLIATSIANIITIINLTHFLNIILGR